LNIPPQVLALLLLLLLLLGVAVLPACIDDARLIKFLPVVVFAALVDAAAGADTLLLLLLLLLQLTPTLQDWASLLLPAAGHSAHTKPAVAGCCCCLALPVGQLTGQSASAPALQVVGAKPRKDPDVMRYARSHFRSKSVTMKVDGPVLAIVKFAGWNSRRLLPVL
jgi:hypothetical protein